jgi:hypothetical protein
MEVPLPAGTGWNAFLLLDNQGTGIWTVKAFPVFKQYATPEVVGLDDKGRCLVLVSYSGKWTPLEVIHEKRWLGGLAHGDLDPRLPGRELYTGGQRGNLYQVVSYDQGVLDFRRIAHLPGKEIHTLLAGDLDPSHPGKELFVFSRPGALYRVTPTGEHGTFESVLLRELPGRVRDAVVLPAEGKGPHEIATVSRAGSLDLFTWTDKGLVRKSLYQTGQGMGRLALAPTGMAGPAILYSTVDDGRILRHVRNTKGTWITETIHVGSQGPRGLVAGRFHEDPDKETVALFGYDQEVKLLIKEQDGWRQEILFTDSDKGHWLSAAELDGRNATEEIIGAGYGGRLFMLTRPPGYGLK